MLKYQPLQCKVTMDYTLGVLLPKAKEFLGTEDEESFYKVFSDPRYDAAQSILHEVYWGEMVQLRIRGA